MVAAQDAGYLAPGGGEVEAVYDKAGTAYSLDDGVRRDSSVANLAKLKPFFDRKYGNVTPGNSSQITDGAAWLLLADEAALKAHDLKPIGQIVDTEWAGLDPAQMGLGPVHAATPILKRNNLGLNDLDYWEINEAFAAQVLGCLAAWKDEKYCKEQLGPRRRDGRARRIEAQRRRRRDRARPPGGLVGREDRAAPAESPEEKQSKARHRVDLHRRRPGRRHARGGPLTMDRIDARAQTNTLYKHWRYEQDAQGLVWLTFDKQNESTNTFSREALDELSAALDAIKALSPKGLIIRSAKAAFIAGADVEAFTKFASPEEALAFVRAGWDVFQKLHDLPFPTTAMVNGYCMGGGLGARACLPLHRRPRRSGDALRVPRSHARHRARLARHPVAAEEDRPERSAGHAADRQGPRCRPREACAPGRPVRALCASSKTPRAC